MSRHAHAFAASIIVMLGFIWMVTEGTFNLFDSDMLGQFYDAQADSLLAGRWDVPRQDIQPEAYWHDGKYYGYYGFVPALPRMLLNRIVPTMRGSWSRCSLTLACAMTLLLCYRLLLRAREWLKLPAEMTLAEQRAYGGFLLLVGLGSTTIYLGSNSFLYHEAIAWAVVFALACYEQLLSYQLNARLGHLILACMFAFLSFFCRISTGSGPFLAVMLVGLNIVAWQWPNLAALSVFRRLNKWTRPPRASHALVAGFALSTIIAIYVAVNHAKFGTLFEAAPMRMYQQETPERLARTGGEWMHLGNIPTVTYAYLSPDRIGFGRRFPWIYLERDLRLFPGHHIDEFGPYASVPAAMPVFLILAVIGVCVVGRGLLRQSEPGTTEEAAAGGSVAPVLIGSLGGIAPLLLYCHVDYRYLHDFLPFLVLAGAFGLHRLLAMRARGWKRAVVAVLVIGGVWQIYANAAFALVYQRLDVFTRQPAPRAQMEAWQRSIDRFLSGGR